MNIIRTLQDFIDTAKANGSTDITVRGPHYSRYYKDDGFIRELRTKKHDHMAVAWDELGNATVLTLKWTVIQLVGSETESLPR